VYRNLNPEIVVMKPPKDFAVHTDTVTGAGNLLVFR
jgi:hypothetical protein